MKRRIAVVAVIATALLSGATAPAVAGSYWGCVVADDVDLGLCVKDPIPRPLPLPERLPLPAVPTVPVPAPI